MMREVNTIPAVADNAKKKTPPPVSQPDVCREKGYAMLF